MVDRHPTRTQFPFLLHYPINMAYQYIHREIVKSAFVRCLRVGFTANPDYYYQENPSDPNQPADNSGVYIYDAWPWKKINYPAIIVSLGPGNPMMRTIGGEQWLTTSEPFQNAQDGLTYSNITVETFGGGESNTVNINVYARSGLDRSQIMDWTAIYLRHFFNAALIKEGITIANMAQGGESQNLIGNDPVYQDTLSVSVFSEFSRDVSTELQGTIDGVCLISVLRMSPNGATSS